MKKKIYKEHWKNKISNDFPGLVFNDRDIYPESKAKHIYDKQWLDNNWGSRGNNQIIQPKLKLSFGDIYDNFHNECVIKPKTNLSGNGLNCFICRSGTEVNSALNKISELYKSSLLNKSDEFIVMPLYKGQYSTHDFQVKDSEIVNIYSYSAVTDLNNSFELFYSIHSGDFNFKETIFKFAADLPDGFYCIEMIDNFIIDAHNRLSSQFYDLEFNLFREWQIAQMNQKLNKGLYYIPYYYPVEELPERYSKVCRVPKINDLSDSGIDQSIYYSWNWKKNQNGYSLNKVNSILNNYETVLSLNFKINPRVYFHENFSDIYSYAYMFINGSNLLDIEKCYSEINKEIVINCYID